MLESVTGRVTQLERISCVALRAALQGKALLMDQERAGYHSLEETAYRSTLLDLYREFQY